jgi:hypothetical protein
MSDERAPPPPVGEEPAPHPRVKSVIATRHRALTAATAIAAGFSALGVIIGALTTSYLNNNGSVELERIKFETGLIVKALDTTDQPTAVKTLKFYANVGLIEHYDKNILVTTDSALTDLIVPTTGVPLRAAMTASIKSFSYQTSQTEVDPGRRDWLRVRPGHWTETYPDGKISQFTEKSHISVNNCPGTVVESDDEPGFQVFIPDRGCPYMSLWFRRNTQPWIDLQPMENIS